MTKINCCVVGVGLPGMMAEPSVRTDLGHPFALCKFKLKCQTSKGSLRKAINTEGEYLNICWYGIAPSCTLLELESIEL